MGVTTVLFLVARCPSWVTYMSLTQACTPESGPSVPVQGAAAVGLGGGGCFALMDTCSSPCVLSCHGLGLDCEQLWVSTGQALLNQLAGNTVQAARLVWEQSFSG